MTASGQCGPTEQQSIEELFAASLVGEYDDHEPWDAVVKLRMMGSPEVFEYVKSQTLSENPRARGRALDVLAQLGAGKPDYERPFKAESISIAIRMMADPLPLVVREAVWALAHLQSGDSQRALISQKNSVDPKVREAVAFGLHGADDPQAIATLIQLMDDKDDSVRDWATFAIGSVPQNDSEEIRAALRKRMKDTYPDARCEAVWGLALRHDRVGLEELLSRLESPEWESGDEIAAQELLSIDRDASHDDLKSGIRKLLFP